MFLLFGWACMHYLFPSQKHDGLGPGPLRDSDHLWGLPNLNKSDRKKLALGNALFRFTIRILELCERWNIPYALENPATSMAWEMQHLQRFCKTYDPNFCHLDFCQFGERWKKPQLFCTTIVTFLLCISSAVHFMAFVHVHHDHMSAWQEWTTTMSS